MSNLSIQQAEELRNELLERVSELKEYGMDMNARSWGHEEGVVISGNAAEMFATFVSEWITTTKELMAGPMKAEDVTHENAARVQTRAKFKFVLIPEPRKVVCLPEEDFDRLKSKLIGRVGAEYPKTFAGISALSDFWAECAEYPTVLYVDF